MGTPMEHPLDVLWASHTLGDRLECGGLVSTVDLDGSNRVCPVSVGDHYQIVLWYGKNKPIQEKTIPFQCEAVSHKVETALPTQALQVEQEETQIDSTGKPKIEILQYRVWDPRRVRYVLRDVWKRSQICEFRYRQLSDQGR